MILFAAVRRLNSWTRIFDLGLQKLLAPFLPKIWQNLFDFLFGFPINIKAKKIEVDILKNVTKIADFRLKIGQIPLLSQNINGHNSVILHPILTCLILNCLFFWDQVIGVKIKALYLLVKILVFGPIFAPRPHIGKIVRMDPKPP